MPYVSQPPSSEDLTAIENRLDDSLATQFFRQIEKTSPDAAHRILPDTE